MNTQADSVDAGKKKHFNSINTNGKRMCQGYMVGEKF